MKSTGEIKKWLLENAKDKNGNLNLSCLDFSDFDGDVNISFMRVKRNLHQGCQEVGGFLWQSHQITGGDLYQADQNVGGEFYNYKLGIDEYWKEEESYTIRKKKLQKITKQQLAEMGYELEDEK